MFSNFFLNFIRIIKRYKIQLIVIFLLIFFISTSRRNAKFEYNTSENFNNDLISNYLDQFIQPNQSTDQFLFCQLPILVLKGHNTARKQRPCRLVDEWGYLKDSMWFFNQTVLQNFPQYKCKYRSILYVSDTKFKYSVSKTLSEGSLITDDQIEVECKGKKNLSILKYKNIHVQIINKLNELKSDGFIEKNTSCRPLNILLLSYDSISRVSWFKRLPKTIKYLTKVMNSTVLRGHTILGDGSFNNLTPLYTGKYPNELPSASKYDPNGKYADEAFPFLWKDLSKNGFVSFHYEDIPHMSTFTFRHRGFLNKTAHHYMKAYTLAVQDSKSSEDDFCIGSVKRSRKALDLVTEFIEMYKNKSNFIALMHNDENSHGDNSMVNLLDNDLESFLKYNFETANLDNTALFLFSDHGVRYGMERMNPQGDLEERLPFFSIFLPKDYKILNEKKVENLKKNANQLTTALDVHRTIKELTCLGEEKNSDLRSFSLFDTIPVNRSCLDIGMQLHYCTCLNDWKFLDKENVLSIKVANDIINEMNKELLIVKDYCAEIKLKTISSIKYTDYLDKKVFRLVFITKPTDGHYEATIYYEKNQTYVIDPIASISRINIYGAHSYCVNNLSKKFNLVRDIRKLCHCN